MNRRIHAEIARVVEISASSFTIETTNFDPSLRHRIFLSFSLDGRPYFISTVLIERRADNRLVLEIPAVVYQTERRDRSRFSPREGDSTRVAILAGDRELESAEIVDHSPQGLGLALRVRLHRHHLVRQHALQWCRRLVWRSESRVCLGDTT